MASKIVTISTGCSTACSRQIKRISKLCITLPLWVKSTSDQIPLTQTWLVIQKAFPCDDAVSSVSVPMHSERSIRIQWDIHCIPPFHALSLNNVSSDLRFDDVDKTKYIYFLSLVTREMDKLKTNRPIYCIIDNRDIMLNLTHTLQNISDQHFISSMSSYKFIHWN